MPKRPSHRTGSAGRDQDWESYRHPSMDYQPPKMLRRVNAALVLLVSTLLVSGLWAGAWYAVSAYVKAQVKAWITAQAAQGAIADYESLETSGFPTRIVLTLTKPHYAGPLAGENVAWQGEALTLSTRLWMPWLLHAEAPGRHEVTIGGGRMAFSGTAQGLSVDINPGDLWPEHLTLAVRGLTMGGSAPLGVKNLKLDLTHDAKVKAGGTGLTLAVQAADLALPVRDWGFGTVVKTLDTAVRVVGPVQPGNLGERIEAWRSVGGAVEVERLRVRFGPMGLAAAGTLALDEHMRPAGAFTAKFEGLFQALEVLRAQGLVRDGDAVFATMALAALSKRPANGGPASINLAVTLQNGKLRLGPVEIMDVPSLDWARPPAEPAPAEPQEPARDYKDAPPVY